MTNNQYEAIEKFNNLKVGALFMQQGTGKTRIAIELANSTGVDLVLFIVPNSLKDNMYQEIDKWGLLLNYHVETYQGIAMSEVRYLELLDLLHDRTVMIVADESIFIKNDKTKTFERMMKLATLSSYRLILNGTPITNNEWDLYNQIHWLSPLILNMSRDEFLHTFFTHVRYKKKHDEPREFYKFSEVNAEYLQRLIEPYTFHVDLDFDKLENVRTINIPASVSTIEKYAELKQELLDNLHASEDYIVRKLRQLEYCCFTDENRLIQISQQISGQMVVFCQFKREIEVISSLLDCYVIHGGISDRTAIIERFKNDNKPLLITLGTGAYGLNLQFCNRIAFTSISFDYGKMEQAEYRIKRLGQTKDIEYMYFTSDLGIYNMIEENMQRKSDLRYLIATKIEEGQLETVL